MENYDLEDVIGTEATKVKGIVEWMSGRHEVFYAELKKDKTIPVAFAKKMQAYKKFPTVIRAYMQKI